MWDMFTDAGPCLDGRCVAKSDSQKLHAVEKKEYLRVGGAEKPECEPEIPYRTTISVGMESFS